MSLPKAAVSGRLHSFAQKIFFRLRRRLILPCAFLTGLLPPLLWLLAAVFWQQLPYGVSLDARAITLAVLLLSPFIAGFVCCRWQPSAEVIAGAAPAFWLWAAAMLGQRWLFGWPSLIRAAVTLAVCLLLGIAGGMSARRIEQIRRKTAPEQQ